MTPPRLPPIGLRASPWYASGAGQTIWLQSGSAYGKIPHKGG